MSFFFSSRRRHTRCLSDWSSDVCSSDLVYGGVGFDPQVQALRRGVDIVVATPGRLLDHVQQKTIDLRQVEILVLDEADRMLDMGFIHDIRRVLALLPAKRQNLLFSATFPDEVRKLAAGFMHDPVTVEVARGNRARPCRSSRAKTAHSFATSSGSSARKSSSRSSRASNRARATTTRNPNRRGGADNSARTSRAIRETSATRNGTRATASAG